MTTVRSFLEKLLFPGWSPATQRRHLRFLLLGVVLGVVPAIVIGLVLYLMNGSGRL